MKEFNIDRINIKKMELGEVPIKLVKTTYDDLKIKDGYLVDEEGYRVGTKGDMYNKLVIDKILQEGCLDHNPRPKYIDIYEDAKFYKEDLIVVKKSGEEIKIDKTATVIEKENEIEVQSKAHTISINDGPKFVYDLSKGETPMITTRPIAIRRSVGEILWIYQKQSNDLVDFDELIGENTWDIDHVIHNWWEQWALKDANGNYILNEKGHPIIGHCYGGTTSKWNMLYHYVIDAIKNNPDGRRNMTCMWQYEDFKKPHGLNPCAYGTTWNVRHGWDGVDYLDMKLEQRSSDFGTAECINQIQYVALLVMVARDLDLEPGIFTWCPANIQIYDRHFDQAITMLDREPINCKATVEIKDTAAVHFKDMKVDDIYIDDYPKELIKAKNPQLKFQLGV